MKMLRRIFAIAHKEFMHLRRDRLTLGMIAGIPLMLTLIFGYGINQDVRHLTAGVADLAGTQAARQLVEDARATQIVNPKYLVDTPAKLEALLREGKISIGIVIPADFANRLARGDRPAAQLLVDGSDPTVFASARQLSQLPFMTRTPPTSLDVVQKPRTFEIRALYNPEGRSAVFVVPGLCAIILTQTLVLFAAASIVREKERGNIELLITTPVQTYELMIGKIVPFIVIGYIQITIILSLGVFLFNVPIAGSLLQLYIAAGVFIAATLAIGLIVSAQAQTQFQSFQISILTLLPQVLLSGFIFPYDGMPRAVQIVAEFMPVTHFLRILRGIVLRDATASEVWPDIWPLFVIFLVLITLAVLRFRKRLD
jgi:ABC-2 type transport system permease protein